MVDRFDSSSCAAGRWLRASTEGDVLLPRQHPTDARADRPSLCAVVGAVDHMAGAVDKVAIIALVIAAYLWTPGNYSETRPLRSWSFTIPLPRKTVEKFLVHDYPKTVAQWVSNVETVSKVKQGFFVRAEQYDAIVQWTRTSKQTWEQRSKWSPLFLKKALRPGTAEISATPSVDVAMQWELITLSPTATEVRRTAHKFEQNGHRWLPMHLLTPLACSAENAAMVKSFVALEASRRRGVVR